MENTASLKREIINNVIDDIKALFPNASAEEINKVAYYVMSQRASEANNILSTIKHDNIYTMFRHKNADDITVMLSEITEELYKRI